VSDRSLDEFAAVSTGSDDADDGTPTHAADADPSIPTMRWSADGAACDACGAVVSRRWLDGADRDRSAADATFVCADCKEW
jgi:hypothetical protein